MDTSILTQILSALADGAAGQAGQRAWTALADLARKTAGHGSAETAAIDAAREQPAPGVLRALAEALDSRAHADPGFAAALGQWIRQTQALLPQPLAVNQVTGPVRGTVIQAGEVSGGIHLTTQPGTAV